MSTPLWAVELAQTFWRQAGLAETFPRDLRRAVVRALDLCVVLLPELWLDAVRDWLRQRALPCVCPGANRPLWACLIASRGQGLIFLDGADPEDEQRFSLAHETAHFLRDYCQPRHRVYERLGSQALAVLDGERPPTTAERLTAVLTGVPLGFHAHLMERDAVGRVITSAVADAEAAADRLAYELLAPAAAILRAGGDAMSSAQRLREVYGLPAAQAARYAELLHPLASPVDPLLRRLGLTP